MRRRIILLASLAAAVAVVLFAVPLAVAVARNVVSDERLELSSAAANTAAAVSGDLTTPASRLRPDDADASVGVYATDGTRVQGNGPEHADALVTAALKGKAGTGSVGARLAAAAPVSDGDSITGAVLATSARADVKRRIAARWAAMLALGLAAVATTALLSRHYSRRLADPIERLAAAAEQLGQGDFTTRTQPVGIAELDTLGSTMNDTAERIGLMMQRQRAFSVDASHQLRTPLTGLRLELEAALNEPGRDLPTVITRALQQADQLEARISDLLSFARNTQQSGSVPVGTLLAALHDSWHGRLAAENRPLRIHTDLADDSALAIPAGHAAQILDVLTDNALRHGRGPVTITVRDASAAIAVDVADDGPDLSEDDVTRLFQRSVGATGHGIGLSLARGLAESVGARLVLGRTSPPTFTLLIPAVDRGDLRD